MSNVCKQCSAGYNYDRDVLDEKYLEQKMPKNWQCFHTNREERVCLTQHSNFIGLLAGPVAGGIVLAVLYLWRKFYRKATMVSGFDESNPMLISPERKGRNIVHQIVNVSFS